ncbi:MAG: AgmX/PglI C-terminal domain-containing protein [Polyangiaceae bacterium]
MQLDRVGFIAGLMATVTLAVGCGNKSPTDPAPTKSAEVAALESASATPEPSVDAAPSPAPSATPSAAPSATPSAAASVDLKLAREAAMKDALEFGMIGLKAGGGGDPAAPTALFGRDDSVGTDPLSARGNMWGDAIGGEFGAGGLGLTGIGEGGGGRGEGIGLGSVGVLGHGSGTGSGTGRGEGSGRLAKPTASVSLRSKVVSGSLPPEVVSRILRSQIGKLRLCYESALKGDPTLAGTVALDFTIDTTGQARNVRNPGAANAAGLCMTKALEGTSFPAPEGGPCEVSASVELTPPDGATKPTSPSAGGSTAAVERIHGKAFAQVEASDVADAMRDAGCTDVVLGSKNGVATITAKYRDAEVVVTVAPATSAPVSSEELKRLRSVAVVLEQQGLFLAIEGPRPLAESLRRAIVVAS